MIEAAGEIILLSVTEVFQRLAEDERCSSSQSVLEKKWLQVHQGSGARGGETGHKVFKRLCKSSQFLIMGFQEWST